MLLLSKLKLWGVAALAAIAAIAATFAKLYKAQRDRARERAERAEAAIELDREIDEADAEIAGEYSEHRARAREDIKNGQVPANLRDSDAW